MDLSEADMKNRLQERLFSRLMLAVWNGRERFHSGDMVSRLTDDCRVVAECICRTVPSIIIAAVQMGSAFIFLWYYSHTLALTLILLLPAFLLAGKAFSRKVRGLTQRIRADESAIQGRMQESLQHRLLLMA